MNRGRLWVWPMIFKETAGGPNIEMPCMDCGASCYATPEYDGKQRCEKCVITHHGVLIPADRVLGEDRRRKKPAKAPGLAGLVNQEARRAYGRVEPDPPPDWPAPVVAAVPIGWREKARSEVPNAVRQMGELAIKCGWWVKVTYARGTLALTTLEPTGEIDEKTGKAKQKQTGPPKVVDSVAVKMTRDSVIAVAIWHDGAYFGGWSTETGPFQRLGANELKGYIRA